MSEPVRAAGGVVWRRTAAGELEVLLVHRPRYDDWTFPKGKNLPGERDEECALREVEEETGLRCRLGAELPSSSYADASGRPKVVRYWAMEPRDGALAPATEADDARWCTTEEAQAKLSYEGDRDVVAAFAHDDAPA